MPGLLIKSSRMIITISCLMLQMHGCSTGNNGQMPVTCIAEKRDFVLTLKADGILEAQRSHILSTPMIRSNKLPKISYLAPEGSFLQKGEVAAEFVPDDYKADLEDALRELDNARSDVQVTEAEHNRQRSQLRTQMESAEKTAESARLQLARLQFVASKEKRIKQLEISRAEKEAEKSRNRLLMLDDVQKEELTQKRLMVKQAQGKADMARKNLAQLTLKAPVSGYVLYEINFFTGEKVSEGDQMIPGIPVVKIPDVSAMQVILHLSEIEVRGLAKDQPATIVVPSLGAMSLRGHVQNVDKIAKPVRRRSRVKSVEVRIATDTTFAALVPGLSANCSIETGLVKEVVVVPLDAIFEKDSVSVVFVRNDDLFESRVVTLGTRGENFTAIDSGLAGGEKLALREPPTDLIIDEKPPLAAAEP